MGWNFCRFEFGVEKGVGKKRTNGYDLPQKNDGF